MPRIIAGSHETSSGPTRPVQSTSHATLQCRGAMLPPIRPGLSGRCGSPARTARHRCSRRLGTNWSSLSLPRPEARPRAGSQSVVGVGLASRVRRFRVAGSSGPCSNRPEMDRTRRSRSSRERAAHPSVDGERVGVLCASVGSEGALAALSEIEDLSTRAVVAIAPSSVIWQAIAEGRPPKKSSWALGGKPLPWVPIHGERLIPELVKNALLKGLSRHPRPSALHLRSAYSTGLHDRGAVEKAEIHVERIE